MPYMGEDFRNRLRSAQAPEPWPFVAVALVSYEEPSDAELAAEAKGEYAPENEEV